MHSISERKPAPLRILLADDNPVNCRIAVLMLEKGGHQIDVVNGGAEAIEAVCGKPYDLVLMDVQMPGIDGLEATRRYWGFPHRPCRRAGDRDYRQRDARRRSALLCGRHERLPDQADRSGAAAGQGQRVGLPGGVSYFGIRGLRKSDLFRNERLGYATQGWSARELMGAEAIFARLVKLERLGRVALLILMLLAVDKQATAQSASFEAWLTQLRQEAAAEGISAATLDRALDGLEPIPEVIERDRKPAGGPSDLPRL